MNSVDEGRQEELVGAGEGGDEGAELPPGPLILNTERLRGLNAISCPVPGCVKKVEGFKSRQALKFHLVSHSKAEVDALPESALTASGTSRKGPFHCSEVGCAYGPGKKELKTNKTAIQHARVHGGGALFICPDCDRSYTLKFRLTEHQKVCGVKAFPCTCGQQFGSKASLRNHVVQAEDGAAHGAVRAARPAEAEEPLITGDEAPEEAESGAELEEMLPGEWGTL